MSEKNVKIIIWKENLEEELRKKSQKFWERIFVLEENLETIFQLIMLKKFFKEETFINIL